jgi:hypothetical protein
MTAHPVRELTGPRGTSVMIDVALVPLIEALWAAGFATVTCCQDFGESIGDKNPRKAAYWKGWVNLELPETDACRLAALATASGWFPVHWADDGAWDMSSPLLTRRGLIIRPDLVQIRFPASQLDDLTILIQVIAGQRRVPLALDQPLPEDTQEMER